MTCTRYIDFGSPPYDAATVDGVYGEDECPGVKAHFRGNPINVGDCIEIDGKDYIIAAVRVKCDGNTVAGDGSPPPGTPPDHTHGYANAPVQVEMWLTEA